MAVNFNRVRRLSESGKSQREIAKTLGISQSYVCDILTGKAGWSEKGAAQVQKLRDRANDERRALRSSLRAENLYDEVYKVIKSSVKPINAPPIPKPRAGKITETAVLHLSDGHHDQVVKRSDTGGLEEYNFEVSCARAANLVDSVIRFTQETLSNFSFPKLVVLAYGDHTSGEIHGHEQRSHFRNQIKNDLAIGQLHAFMLRELAAYFPKVEVLYLAGNHGRRTEKKLYPGGPHDNHDYMVARIAEAHLLAVRNVSFDIPDAWTALKNIEGYNFHVSHGDDVGSTMGEPWSGLRKRHERLAPLHRQKIDYQVIGHHHTFGTVAGNGTDYLCNGAWVSTDAYAYNSLGVAGDPVQLLHGVHRDHGVSWRLPVRLKDGANSSRYFDSVKV
jgi:predicted transcriptional regulator